MDDKRSSTSNSYLNIDKFKTWPSKTTSNDSFKNLNQIDESPVHRPKTKSKSNSFESAIGDAANTTIDEHKATDVSRIELNVYINVNDFTYIH